MMIQKPINITRYKWRKFIKEFEHGCVFWDGIDGNLTGLTILFDDNLEQQLSAIQEQFDYLSPDWKNMKLVKAHVEHIWPEDDFDFAGERRRKLWMLTKYKPTPFPIYYADYKVNESNIRHN